MESGMDRRLILASAGLAGVAGVAALGRMAKAGPIDPPQGPISSTGKTMQQVYDRVARGGPSAGAETRLCIQDLPSSPDAQFVVSQGGAYYVGGDITGESGKCCILIDTRDDVDIDCNGCTFRGVQGTLSCIRASAPPGVSLSNFEVYDAAFRGWQGCCIDLPTVSSCFVSDCSFHECVCPDDAVFGPGAVCRCGPGSEVCDCDVRFCTGSLIRCGPASSIDDCSCMSCAGGGMRCGENSCISNCFVVGNDAPSLSMIQCGGGSEVCDCDVRDCFGPAITVGSSCDISCCSVTGGSGGAMSCGVDSTVEDCSVLHHVGSGILGLDRCNVEDCVVRSCNGAAISVGSSSSIECCTCDECPSGFTMGNDSCCEDCDALHIAGTGITGGDRSRVCDCDMSFCDSWSVIVGERSNVECCSAAGGGGGGSGGIIGGGIQCGSGSCACDCSVVATTGPSILCASRCTLCRCHCESGWGIEVHDQCSVYENECIECISLQPLGGALIVHGQLTCVEDNYCSGGGIVLLAGADACVVENNQCAGSGSTIPGTGGGVIFLDSSVRGCTVVRNRCRGSSTSSAFSIPPSNSFGPLCNVSAGGDMSGVAGSSHHLCNQVY